MRQIEIAETMVCASNSFTGCAEALVLGTAEDQPANPDEQKKKKGMSAEDLENEMSGLERDPKTVTNN